MQNDNGPTGADNNNQPSTAPVVSFSENPRQGTVPAFGPNAAPGNSPAPNLAVIALGFLGFILFVVAFLARSIVVGVIGVLFVVAASVIGMRVNKKQKANEAATMSVFATQRGLTYTQSPPLELAQAICKVKPLLNHLTSGQDGDFFLAELVYNNSGGPNHLPATTLSSIRRLAYQKLSTAFFLVPKGYGVPSLNQSEVFNLDGLEKYSFEGQEINNRYNCYIQTGSETDALTFLSPDTLVWLETNYSAYPIILKDGYLYVFGEGLSPQFLRVADYAAQYDATRSTAAYLNSKQV